MNQTLTPVFRLTWLLLLVLLAVPHASARADEAKYEVQLIWAANDKKSPDPKHKEVEPDIRKKLDELPLKWVYYFEVNRKRFTVPKGEKTKAMLSEKCAIEVKYVDGKKVEVTLIDKKGEAVLTRTQPLSKGEIVVLAGKAPNDTAWLVALKRIE